MSRGADPLDLVVAASIGQPRAVAWRSSEHRVIDEASGVAHLVTIDVPHRFDKLDRPPVIVCLDGAWTAGAMRDATRVMAMGREAPEAIVVGVSFDEPDMAAYLRARACWYTPTGWVPPVETGVRDVTPDDTGKAAAFHRFLREQVLPVVDNHAPFGERWLFGHSFSALFGVHTLLTEPAMFDRYLLASPSIWWHDRSILGFERAWAADNDDLAATVFLSAGAHEGGTSFDDDVFRMYGNVEELVARLCAGGYPSLELHFARLTGESHNSTIGAAISAGLRALHAPESLRSVGDDRVRVAQARRTP